MQKVSYKYRQFLFFLVKLSIVFGAFYFIYQRTVHNNSISLTEFVSILEKHLFTNSKVLFIILAFTIFNWFFEILKWKNLVTIIKKITLFEAFKQSLGSHTASLFTPNRIGEYGAKAFYFYKDKRKKVLLLNLISNISQMTVTILFGVIGIIFIITNYEVHLPIFKVRKLVYYLAIFTASIFGGRAFISKKIRGFYLAKIIQFFKNLPRVIVLKTFVYSVIRYIIFSHQFYFLLLTFGVEIDYNILIRLIFAMYLFASVVPSLPMFDWLIKGSVAVFVFGLVGINELIIVSVTTIMWLLNFALPAIIGSYFVLNFKYTFSKN